jgi:hypothetical protein
LRRLKILIGYAMLRTFTSRDLFSVVAIIVLEALGTVQAAGWEMSV